MVATTHEGGKA
jgi:coronin-2